MERYNTKEDALQIIADIKNSIKKYNGKKNYEEIYKAFVRDWLVYVEGECYEILKKEFER